MPLLVRAIAGADPDLAAEAAMISQRTGHVGAELGAWEEAAVAASAAGDRDLGPTWARRAIDVADRLGARTVERRLAARLRRNGLRLGVVGARGRPTTGWASLTSPNYGSPSTSARAGPARRSPPSCTSRRGPCRPHISNILRKLDLHTRAEIAGVVARQH